MNDYSVKSKTKKEYWAIQWLTFPLIFLYQILTNYFFPENKNWSVLTSIIIQISSICIVFAIIYALYRQKRFPFLQKFAVYFSFLLFILTIGSIILLIVYLFPQLLLVVVSLFLMVGLGFYLLQKGMKNS
jgi:hypothetical protein